MSKNSLLGILESNARVSIEDLALQLESTVTEVAEEIDRLTSVGVILGYRAIVDDERAGRQHVSAMIEVRVTPERGGGFDRLATRIARYDQVKDCHLMSGGYDLLVVVQGADLRDVASFVSQKLSSLEGVLSTATHFLLKTYKQDFLLNRPDSETPRLPVSP